MISSKKRRRCLKESFNSALLLVIDRLYGLVLLQRANISNPTIDGLLITTLHTLDNRRLTAVGAAAARASTSRRLFRERAKEQVEHVRIALIRRGLVDHGQAEHVVFAVGSWDFEERVDVADRRYVVGYERTQLEVELDVLRLVAIDELENLLDLGRDGQVTVHRWVVSTFKINNNKKLNTIIISINFGFDLKMLPLLISVVVVLSVVVGLVALRARIGWSTTATATTRTTTNIVAVIAAAASGSSSATLSSRIHFPLAHLIIYIIFNS